MVLVNHYLNYTSSSLFHLPLTLGGFLLDSHTVFRSGFIVVLNFAIRFSR